MTEFLVEILFCYGLFIVPAVGLFVVGALIAAADTIITGIGEALRRKP